MADTSRIDDLRRRVQKDPASIAFAQLAEECRRARQYQEAVDICRAGLEIHPGYLSARVTLGRAFVELGQLEEAQAELTRVLESAPENLAAIRGLAEIYHRRGDLPQALLQYRAALLLARNDPDLEETIADLSRQVEPPVTEPETGELTLEHMQHELLKLGQAAKAAPPPVPDAPPSDTPPPLWGAPSPTEDPAPDPVDTVPVPEASAATVEEFEYRFEADVAAAAELYEPATMTDEGDAAGLLVAPVPPVDAFATPVGDTLTPPVDDRAIRTIAALEQWLGVIHVARAERRP